MPQSLSQVYVHIVFSTKNRINSIDETIEAELHKYIGGICNQLKCFPVQVGGHLNHIHILCTLSRDIKQSKLLQEIKQHSSKWGKTKGEQYSNFYWQNGYGIFSVICQQLGKLTNYILNQKQHHNKIKFKNEYRNLLNQHNVEFDEKYLWE